LKREIASIGKGFGRTVIFFEGANFFSPVSFCASDEILASHRFKNFWRIFISFQFFETFSAQGRRRKLRASN